MTQEEKAKAYDEALKKARELYNEAKEGEFFTIMSDYEEIFPQLRESEDERIRKDIINLIYWLKGNPSLCSQYYKDRYDDMLAWLEKQKEQKPEGKQEQPPYFYCKYGGTIPKCSDCKRNPSNSQYKTEEIKSWMTPTLGTKQCSDYIQQKPVVEWNGEDKTYRDFILESLEDQIRFCKKDAEGAHYTKQIRAAQNWLKSLPLNLKKKNEDVAKLCSNEWSEEDEKIAKEIEEELWYPGDFPDYPSKEESELYDDCQRRLDWFKNKLKSLRSQPKQEWSGEDERKLQKCIKIVERWEEDYDIAYAPYSNILKSLKPFWKPTKEQIRTLDIVISDYRHACTKDSDKKAEILKPLLEQIKKL